MSKDGTLAQDMMDYMQFSRLSENVQYNWVTEQLALQQDCEEGYMRHVVTCLWKGGTMGLWDIYDTWTQYGMSAIW